MLQATLQILLYAILAGLSPFAFTATFAVLHAGRPKAVAFGVGFVSAQLTTCALLVAVGGGAGNSVQNQHTAIQVTFEIAAAVALVWVAGRFRRRPPTAGAGQSERTRSLVERLGRLRLGTTLVAGVVLGVGVPKRLVLAALAATTISTSNLHTSAEATLVLVYVAVATALVWAPVILFVIFGDRAVAVMKRAQAELTSRQPAVAIYAFYTLAAMFAIEAAGTIFMQRH